MSKRTQPKEEGSTGGKKRLRRVDFRRQLVQLALWEDYQRELTIARARGVGVAAARGEIDAKYLEILFGAGGAELLPEQNADGKPKNDEDLMWDLLLEAGLGKVASVPARLEWIYENMGVEVWMIDPQTVPSAGAVAHLRAAQACPNDFYRGPFIKMIPSKASMEGGEFTDDGRSQLRALEALDAGGDPESLPVLPSGPEESGGERPIPPESPGVGEEQPGSGEGDLDSLFA